MISLLFSPRTPAQSLSIYDQPPLPCLNWGHNSFLGIARGRHLAGRGALHLCGYGTEQVETRMSLQAWLHRWALPCTSLSKGWDHFCDDWILTASVTRAQLKVTDRAPCSTISLSGPSLEIIATSDPLRLLHSLPCSPHPPPEPTLPSWACILQQDSLFPAAVTKPSMSSVEYLHLTSSQRPFLLQEERKPSKLNASLKKGKASVLNEILN